jgi:hypothetical protein
MKKYGGVFSISFCVEAEDEDDAADKLYAELDDCILHGISAAAFALHDDIEEYEITQPKEKTK